MHVVQAIIYSFYIIEIYAFYIPLLANLSVESDVVLKNLWHMLLSSYVIYTINVTKFIPKQIYQHYLNVSDFEGEREESTFLRRLVPSTMTLVSSF